MLHSFADRCLRHTQVATSLGDGVLPDITFRFEFIDGMGVKPMDYLYVFSCKVPEFRPIMSFIAFGLLVLFQWNAISLCGIYDFKGSGFHFWCPLPAPAENPVRMSHEVKVSCRHALNHGTSEGFVFIFCQPCFVHGKRVFRRLQFCHVLSQEQKFNPEICLQFPVISATVK